MTVSDPEWTDSVPPWLNRIFQVHRSLTLWLFQDEVAMSKRCLWDGNSDGPIIYKDVHACGIQCQDICRRMILKGPCVRRLNAEFFWRSGLWVKIPTLLFKSAGWLKIWLDITWCYMMLLLVWFNNGSALYKKMQKEEYNQNSKLWFHVPILTQLSCNPLQFCILSMAELRIDP